MPSKGLYGGAPNSMAAKRWYGSLRCTYSIVHANLKLETFRDVVTKYDELLSLKMDQEKVKRREGHPQACRGCGCVGGDV